jgi:hypothetical protein
MQGLVVGQVMRRVADRAAAAVQVRGRQLGGKIYAWCVSAGVSTNSRTWHIGIG